MNENELVNICDQFVKKVSEFGSDVCEICTGMHWGCSGPHRLWGDKSGEPLTSRLRDVDIKGNPDDQCMEALISHRD